MDQDIDLREYIAVLLKYKFWIAGLAIGAALVALVVSLFLPPTYQATALVAITKPKYEMQFDSRFALVGGNALPPYKAYPLLATSDELLDTLAAELRNELTAEAQAVDVLRAARQERRPAARGDDREPLGGAFCRGSQRFVCAKQRRTGFL